MKNANKVELEKAIIIASKKPVALQCLGEWVLLKEPKEIDKIGAIIIPDSARRTPNIAQVASKGEKCNDTFQVGDVVMFAPNCGTPVEHNGQAYLIMNQHGIQAVQKAVAI